MIEKRKKVTVLFDHSYRTLRNSIFLQTTKSCTSIMPKSSSKQKAETIVEIDEESMSSDGDSEALADENEPNTEISKTKVTGKELAPASRKTVSQEQSSHVENDSFDVILPPLLGSGNSGECTVMIEVDPEDAALLDYEGISGAIGRFEADDRGGK